MMRMGFLSYGAGHGKPAVHVTLLLLLFLVGVSPAGWAQQAISGNDNQVGFDDLLYLLHRWNTEDITADQNYDRLIDQEDLLLLKSDWHKNGTIEPYPRGRAVGIYAVTEYQGEEYISEETELAITDETLSKPGIQSSALTRPVKQPGARSALGMERSRSNPLADDSLPSNDEVFNFFSRTVAELEAYAESDGATVLSALEPQYGVRSPEIGTFGGWSVWIGWAASWSETYEPKCESRAWVVYFAPEAAYVALQWAKSAYSDVSVFAGVSSFFGALVSPGGAVLQRDYINSLLGVSLSIDLGIVEQGPTLFRVGESKSLERAVQYNIGKSVSYGLLPISLPFGVTLDNESGMTNIDGDGTPTGFYPIIIWNIEDIPPGNPVNPIVAKLTEVAGWGGDTFIELVSAQTARIILLFLSKLQTSGTVTLEDDVPPASNAAYFGEFLQSTSPGAGANTSIDYMIARAENWLQTGQTDDLGEVVGDLVKTSVNTVGMYEDMKTIKAGTQMCFQLGYRHGRDSQVQDGTRLYADCVKSVTPPVGEWCALEVSVDEILELLPHKSASDFEGVNVWFRSEGIFDWENVPLENGMAIYWLQPESNLSFIVEVTIDPEPATDNKTLELCRWVVEPHYEAGLLIQGSASPDGEAVISDGNSFSAGAGKVQLGKQVELSTSVTDESGMIVTAPTMVRFYDYRDVQIGDGIQTEDGFASLSFIPKVSIPRVDDVQTTQVGYSEEDITTGFSVEGRGFSVVADLLINGVSINTMTNWEWAVLSSKNILARPVEEQYRLTQTSTIQVINPEGIASNAFVYTP